MKLAFSLVIVAAFHLACGTASAQESKAPANKAAEEHKTHKDHKHKHGKDCGHKSVQHGEHVDYQHDGHSHKVDGDHVDECASGAKS